MAKEKIRKLRKEVEEKTTRINKLAAMLALLTHRNGGHLSFTEEDIDNMPDAFFRIDKEKSMYTLSVNYETEST